MPLSLEPSAAWRLGAAFAPLAGDGVLVVGSGSLTHNLYEFRQGPGHDAAYAVEFVEWVRDAALSRDRERLLSSLTDAPHARQAHPTAEHFLPLLVAAGAPADNATVEVLYGGMTHGVLSMESYLFGAGDASQDDLRVSGYPGCVSSPRTSRSRSMPINLEMRTGTPAR